MGDAAERIAAALEGLLEIERERRAEERMDRRKAPKRKNKGGRSVTLPERSNDDLAAARAIKALRRAGVGSSR
tara:strand:+ start:1902 stop:2120 length:219 start_codon:yes stop_codon:yes gene_type:complete